MSTSKEVSSVMRSLALRRWRKTTAAQRRAHGRKLALARWGKGKARNESGAGKEKACIP